MKTSVILLVSAMCLINTDALAGGSNPMSPSYNAVTQGKTMTERRDAARMNARAPADARSRATRKRNDM